MSNERLAEWLLQACKERGISAHAASVAAGIAPNAISEIANNASKPTLTRLLKLARFFDVEPEFLIRLAGDLPMPEPPTLDQFSPAVSAKIDAIIRKWQQLTLLDPDGANDLIAVVEMQAQLALALARKHKPETTEEPA